MGIKLQKQYVYYLLRLFMIIFFILFILLFSIPLNANESCVKEILENNTIDECYAVEGFSALHLVDDIPKFIVSFKNGNNSYQVFYKDNKIIHNQIINTKKLEL